jgi:Cof subfamily protein (haloacid dehalogenase superfamily)
MVKLIVADMDGTLLDDNKRLPADFWETEQLLHDKGILFAIASGRQFYNLAEVFDRIKDRILFLADNGTFVWYRGEELFTNPLGKAAAGIIIETGRKIPDAYLILCGKKAAYIENHDERFLKILYRHYSKVEVVEDLTKVEDMILKVTLCDFRDSATNSASFYGYLGKDYNVAVSGLNWLDITNSSANKGSALVKIQQKLGITSDETVAFGDYLNDIEMMAAAKYSYAMKNAHPEIMRVSGYVTAFDNNESGVTKAIRGLIL